MKRQVVLLILFVVVAAIILYAQKASDMLTVQGTVKEVIQPGGRGYHVLINDGAKDFEVCLGRSDFLEQNGLLPKVGDRLEVKGRTVGSGARQMLMAESVKQGDRVITLPNRSSMHPTAGCCEHMDCGSGHYMGHAHHGHHCGWQE